MLDKIAVQLSGMEIPYGELRVEVKAKEASETKSERKTIEDKPSEPEPAAPRKTDRKAEDQIQRDEETELPPETDDAEAGEQAAPAGERPAQDEKTAEEEQPAAECSEAQESAAAASAAAGEKPEQDEASELEQQAADDEGAQAAVEEPQEGLLEETEVEAQAPSVEAKPQEAEAEVDSDAAESVQSSVEAAEQPAADEAQAGEDADLTDAFVDVLKQQLKGSEAAAADKAVAAGTPQGGSPEHGAPGARQDKGEAQVAAVLLRHIADAVKFADGQPAGLVGLQTAVEATAVKGKTDAQETGLDKAKTKALSRQLAARTLEKVEAVLKEVARSRDGKTISVRLDPPNLGRVRVDVTLRDGALHARITAETPQVNQLLRERAGDLQLTLRRMGMNVDKVTVSVAAEQGDYNAGSQSSDSRRPRSQQARDEADMQQAPHAPAGDAEPRVSALEDHWIA